MKKVILICAVLIFLVSTSAKAQEYEGKKITDVSAYVTSRDLTKPFYIVVKFTIAPEWHLYWKNPGDAGTPPNITVSLPAGYFITEFQFPTPKRFEVEGIVGYGYTDELILTAKVTPSPTELASHRGKAFPITAQIKWLVCKEVCIPGEESVTIARSSFSLATIKKAEQLFKKAADLQPRSLPESGMLLSQAVLIKQNEKLHRVALYIEGTAKIDTFFPEEVSGGILDLSTLTISETGPGIFVVSLNVKGETSALQSIKGIVVINGKGYAVESSLSLDETGGHLSQEEKGVGGKEAGSRSLSLWQMLLFAFLGGLILNLMPCVLPALSLKVLSFAEHARHGKSLAMNGVWFSLGVLVSFWILATVVVLVKGAGQQIGWGFQFQSPYFVLVLLAIVWVFSLNLFGVFEVGGVAVSGKVGDVVSRNDKVGSFFSGALATVLATPCTAPFLSVALGFAFSQSAAMIFLFFSVIAMGLNTPYVILSLRPQWLSFIPKPGEWMNKLRQFMGFLLVATAIWLLYVIYGQRGGEAVIVTLVGLFALAIAAWMIGSLLDYDASQRKKIIVWTLTIILVLGSCYFVVRSISTMSKQNASSIAGGNDWQPFSEVLVKSSVDDGKVVFVYFTADWCLTCKVNEKTVIETEEVQSKMKEAGVIKVKGDWTNYNADIGKALEGFGRAGVPLYVIYPPKQYDKPILLPELITANIVLDGLESAINHK